MKPKNKTYKIALIFLVLGLTLTLYSCRKKGTNKFGQDIATNKQTTVESILNEPQNFESKTITIEGEIIRECPTGCWLDVRQNHAIIHVDLNPSGFAIPQKVGKDVKVEGKVLLKNNQPMIIGTGVEIK